MSERQLQFFDPKAKRYVPALTENADPKHARSIACGRGWRIARSDRELRPTYRGPTYTAASRSSDEVRAEYLKWAIKADLSSITDWNKKANQLRPFYYGAVKCVSPEELFAVEHSEVAEAAENANAKFPLPVTLAFANVAPAGLATMNRTLEKDIDLALAEMTHARHAKEKAQAEYAAAATKFAELVKRFTSGDPTPVQPS